VKGFQTTSMDAFSGFSPFLVPGLGPYTAATTAVPPCSHRADPCARPSGFRVHEYFRSWFAFLPSALSIPSPPTTKLTGCWRRRGETKP
jgi:hypothetical protein